jgi:hypothetical protein
MFFSTFVVSIRPVKYNNGRVRSQRFFFFEENQKLRGEFKQGVMALQDNVLDWKHVDNVLPQEACG